MLEYIPSVHKALYLRFNAVRDETKNNEDFLFCLVEGTHRLLM